MSLFTNGCLQRCGQGVESSQRITLGPQMDVASYQNLAGESHIEKVSLTYDLRSRDSQERSQESRNSP